MMMLFWLVVLVAVLAVLWMIVQRGGFGSGATTGGDRSEALLRERYARGEIDEATYRRMLEDLRRR